MAAASVSMHMASAQRITPLEAADPGHHVAADTLERPQHERVVADDVAHHHVVEAHLAVAMKRPDDGVRAAHEELIETRAPIPLGENGPDDGARLLVGRADVDVAAQDRPRRAPGTGPRPPIPDELPPEILPPPPLAPQPGHAQASPTPRPRG